jgi:PAS domain S-box-containing protein
MTLYDLKTKKDQGPHSDVFAGGGDMGRLMANIDWAKTPIGSVDTWPQSLLTAVSICLSSRFPILLLWGADLVTIYNDAYRPVLGQKHPRALGRAGRECWPEIWDVIGPMLEGVLARGEATWSDDQLLLLDRNGYTEECYFTFSYSPIRDEAGGVGGVFTAVTETTERVLSERRLSCLTRLTEMTASAPAVGEACAVAVEALANHPDIPFCGLYHVDGARTQAILRGRYPEELLFAGHVDLTDESASALPVARVVKTGQAIEVEVSAVLTPGCCIATNGKNPDRAMLLPVLTADREVTAVLVAGLNPGRALDEGYRRFLQLVGGHVATAIANARAFEEERKRAESLAELDEAKTRFFSNISHEFRTPLTLLLGPLDDVLADQSTPSSPGQRERLEVVRRNARRLLKLVNTLLDFSRIEAGRLDAVFRPVDLPALTADLASVFRSAVERAGLRLIVDCPSLPEPAYVDPDLWEKIVFNLLSNALKFTFHGEIVVRMREEGGTIHLDVIDTGIGIPANELPHLFDRFHRVRGARSRSHEGSGIGLSLVRELARLHGGDVAVTSEVDGGSRFSVTIPLGRAHLPPDKIGSGTRVVSPADDSVPFLAEATQWVAAEEPAPGFGDTPGPLSDQRVLVVDDNADMREYIQRVLEDHCVVETVADGVAALAVVEARRPDLILSDVMMPGSDGFALLRTLKGDPRTADIPFIMLSARAGEEASIEGLQAGADDYLIKPFSAPALLARISAALQRRQAERRIMFQAHLLDMIAEAVIAIDLRGRVLYWNRHAEMLLGWDAEELLGTDIMETVVPVQTPEVAEIARRVMQGEKWSGEVEGHRRDGSTFVASLSASPVLDAHGRAIGAVGVGTDITARKKMEEDLNRMQKLDSIGVLAGGIAHDFNNILTALFGNITLAKLGTTEPGAVTALDEAEKAFWRARALTNQLLTFAKGGAPVRRIGYVGPLLREAPQLALTGSNVTCNLDAPKDLWAVDFDPGQVSQTLNNLLLNAKEAMPNGGVVDMRAENVELGEQEVSSLPAGRYVRISVTDHGCGIPADYLAKIFDPYFSTKATGTGLGLAITHSIVKRHGGHIEVESQPGLGSTFRIYLPASPSLESADVPKASAVRKGVGKVLLMDDDPGVRHVGSALLKELGYEVELAQEGGEALVAYQRALMSGDRFDHVILDLTVRDGMGGKECLEKLRALDPGARVLVSSGYSNDPMMADYARYGFNGVISKPYRFEELSQALFRRKGRPR